MKVLVCPLDWGLGHAARCIPLVRALLENGHEVLIGAGGGGAGLLRAEFPGLVLLDFPGYRVRYARRAAFFLPVLLAQLPALLAGLALERLRLRALITRHRPDLVISDGRYGLATRRVPVIFITHQLFLRLPGSLPGSAWVERLLLRANQALLRRFREVWVPDYPGAANLSGELSHRAGWPGRAVFIHPLSRFRAGPAVPRVDVLAAVSGPEPQRALLEAALRRELAGLPGTRVLVRGLPGPGAAPECLPELADGGLHVFDHLGGEALSALFQSARLVVARAGYTTIMELAGLGCAAAVLVPTPGQSEQEYLAEYLDRSAVAMRQEQDGLDLRRAQGSLARYSGFAGFRSAGGDFSLAEFLRVHPLFRGR